MDGEPSTKEARIRAAAARALAEAEARRRGADDKAPLPPETGGSEGPEPTRYGDWEKKGITSDF
ncbi:MAG: succinate dehydrogenase assembly factor 4 [Pseudomonadota bacterium]